MPGLLDLFGGDPQQQGLLAMAAQMMQASGPSTTPRSFGQVAGSGLLAGMQANQQAQQQQQARLLNGMQTQKAGLELEQMRGNVDRMKRIRDRLTGPGAAPAGGLLNGAPYSHDEAQSAITAASGNGMADLDPAKLNQIMAASRSGQGGGLAGANPFSGADQSGPTNYLSGGDNSPRIGGPAWMQAYQTQQQGKQPPPPAAAAAAGRKSATQQLVERLTYTAGVYSDEGDIEGANKLLEHAAKFMPEVHKIEVALDGGRPVNVITFKDGTQKVSEFGATPKLHFADNGTNTAIPINEYTGLALNNGIKRTATPDAIMADSRAREFNAIQQDANNIKRGEKQADARMTKNSQVASFDTMLGTLDRLSSHPGLSRSVGVAGAFPTMPGSDSANFQAELNTFQSQAFLPMVAQLKGMGALSDAEGKKLTAAVGALDPRMGEEAFRSSISRIKSDMDAARQRVAGSMDQAGQRPATGTKKSALPGQVVRGYRFKGGDPSMQENWEKM
jgi:hypothetical protein